MIEEKDYKKDENEEDEKPKHLKVFKIIGFVAVFVAVVGFSLIGVGASLMIPVLFIMGGFLGVFGLFVGITFLILGFQASIHKMNVKTARYIQNKNKEDLKNISLTQAEISKEAIKTSMKAVKEGLEEDKIYCKYCGAKIDKDSKFCSQCGKEL